MNVSERVESILKHSVQARNSDKELILIYMQKVGMDLDSRQVQRFRDMPSFETLRRIRQKIQEGGKYPASKEVKKTRDFKAMQVQQQAPKFKPDGLERTLSGQVVLPDESFYPGDNRLDKLTLQAYYDEIKKALGK